MRVFCSWGKFQNYGGSGSLAMFAAIRRASFSHQNINEGTEIRPQFQGSEQ